MLISAVINAFVAVAVVDVFWGGGKIAVLFH